ncbi:MAG: acyl-ACP--UDP-N-acetylglucosamine O-acyltransferase [Planctomycetes bacterium]|nr:acyl-ACP--UDP-N-acetylglucosamine O-acyltransferase [Planctomycetota bacterium]
MPVHPTAIVDPRAKIDPTAHIGPFCVIEGEVEIGANCRLLHAVFVTGWTTLGPDCEIHPHVVIGHAPQDIKYQGQRSFCRIGRGCIIRENASIHRGTIPDSETIIGEGCFLLAGAHVGHNCTVGNKVTLINNVLLAGHVAVEDRVTVGGAAAIHQFVRIGELAMVAGAARVRMDIPPFALSDSMGRVAGLNRIGLRRNEYGRDELVALREAYKVLYGGAGGFADRVCALRVMARTPATKKLLRFVEAPSKRGLAGRTRGRAGRATDDSDDAGR